jgi:hypothetical protein
MEAQMAGSTVNPGTIGVQNYATIPKPVEAATKEVTR